MLTYLAPLVLYTIDKKPNGYIIYYQLISLTQGEKMSNYHFVNSALHVKACENLENEILKDLQTPQGKSVANLLNGQKTPEENDQENNQNKESAL
jgi:hypothetical protein